MKFQSEIKFKLPEDRNELKWLMGIYYVVVWCAGVAFCVLLRLALINPIVGFVVLCPYAMILYIHFKLSPMVREAWRRIRNKEEVD